MEIALCGREALDDRDTCKAILSGKLIVAHDWLRLKAQGLDDAKAELLCTLADNVESWKRLRLIVAALETSAIKDSATALNLSRDVASGNLSA